MGAIVGGAGGVAGGVDGLQVEGEGASQTGCGVEAGCTGGRTGPAGEVEGVGVVPLLAGVDAGVQVLVGEVAGGGGVHTLDVVEEVEWRR